MEFNFLFFFNSALLGVGLAMDAFSVSLANGLNEPGLKRSKMFLISGVFAVFQAAMPMLGWLLVHTAAQRFSEFQKLIPWIALFLLSIIGGKMLKDGITHKNDASSVTALSFTVLLVQGFATSIDALSVGFTISDYNLTMAVVCALIIAVVTFFICFAGIILGKKFGTRLAGKASIFGGVILIGIGLEIFISGILK